MTSELATTLVLNDPAGSYFLVPQATLERCRVPEQRSADVERLIAETDDVSGLVLGWVIAGIGAGIALAVAEPGRFFGSVLDYDQYAMHRNP